MKQLAHPRRIVVIVLCLLSDYLITVNAQVCEVGRERSQHNKWNWVLPYPDPCKCTKIIMGGMNTWTPIRPFVPVYVDSLLLSDDIIAIREHYGLTCNTGTTPDLTDTSSCSRGLSSSDSSASSIRPEEEATTNLSTENYASTSSGFSLSSQAKASGAEYGTEAGASEHVASGRTAAESSTDSETSDASETSKATSAEAETSEQADTTALGSTAAESSTTSATSDPIETSGVTSTEAGIIIKTSPTSSISTSSSTTPKVCNEYMGVENGDIIPDENIKASHYYTGYPPWNGRLNGETTWACQPLEATLTWIQADIGYQTYVSGVITQGDGSNSGGITADWVTSLKVSTFKMTTTDQEVFVTDENDNVKVFQANTDRDTPVPSMFPIPVYARIVRITCIGRNDDTGNYWNIRFEILGCKQAVE